MPIVGQNIIRTLLRVWSRQEVSVLSKNRQSSPSLAGWSKSMSEQLAKDLEPYVVRGGRQQMAELAGGVIVKSAPRLVFNSGHPKVREFLRRWSFDFCQETNATTKMRLDRAYAELKRQLREGIEAGEARAKLADRVHKIFRDRGRAERIARTEVNRVTNGGRYLAAEQSGRVKKKKWRARRNACPKCLALNGQVVPLDEPFTTIAGVKEPYSTIMYPPYHPTCNCFVTYLTR